MTTQTQRMVFISYSHVDTGFVNLFGTLLVNLDIQIYKDSKDLPIGGEILDSLYDAIKNASHFCCIISSSSVKSQWVKEELSYAKHRRLDGSDIAIVPILIDEVQIPDYVKIYRCAHLEDRKLSLDNPELIMTLRAFGLDLADAPQIITGRNRRRLLQSCGLFQERIFHLRQKLETFQERYKAYRTAAVIPRTIMIRDTSFKRRGIGFRIGGGRRSVFNPAYSTIKVARDRERSALIDLMESSSWLPKPIKSVRQALQGAGLTESGDAEKLSRLSVPGVEGNLPSSDTYLWRRLESALDSASEISEAIYKVSGGDDEEHNWAKEVDSDQPDRLWWTNEKLQRWITKSIPEIEAAIENAIGTLDYWGRFDSDSDE